MLSREPEFRTTLQSSNDACARKVLPNIIYGIKNCDTMK